jgi:hypothetical protein
MCLLARHYISEHRYLDIYRLEKLEFLKQFQVAEHILSK